MLKVDAEPFLSTLLVTPHLQATWNIRNGGVPIFVHTIDVVMLCLDAFDEWQERHGPMQLLPTVVGALLHDLTKVTARQTRGQPTHLSHSDIMRLDPQAAVVEGRNALDAVRAATGISLDDVEQRLVAHIIMSHHGVWGSVPPQCPEAALVHYCDLYSARWHRQPPIDANDILPLLATGVSKAGAARILGVTPKTISDRLLEACRAEWLDSTDELLAVWQRRGRVVGGDEETQEHRRIIHARAVQAQNVPTSLLTHPRFRSWLDQPDP